MNIVVSMNVAAGPELAAAVTNAGGLGVIGGVGYTPKILRQQVSLRAFSSLGGRRGTCRSSQVETIKPSRAVFFDVNCGFKRIL